jgi:hypothetical protein
VGLLILSRVTGERELALFSYFMMSGSAFALFMNLSAQGYLDMTQRQWTLLYLPLQFFAPFAGIFFTWTFFRIPWPFVKYISYAAVTAMAAGLAVVMWAYTRYPWLPGLSSISYGANAFFGVLYICADIWAMLFRPGKRVLAFVMSLVPAADILSTLFGLPPLVIGRAYIDGLALTSLVVDVVMATVLARRAWTNWREGASLHAEMDAAREVQQQLVSAPPTIPGFTVNAAYLPASQVGGDFYRVTQLADGDLLLIAGDVSGKGLRAAMTVSTIMGALRAIYTESPAAILILLNNALAGQLRSGFVTCCALRISPGGQALIAKAGHIPPYIAGSELDLPGAFPPRHCRRHRIRRNRIPACRRPAADYPIRWSDRGSQLRR